ncbi:branched-chain amino acid ABC transporter permease [Hypericibacter adhaerens]|nr:branched-chain amino acid ABC transporter permease [Hypericibacter adhaerens]
MAATWQQSARRHPYRLLLLLVLLLALAWLFLAVWPPGFEAVFGKKKVFVSAVLNGLTLGSLYFLVACGFSLIFGLMKNVNLAHGTLYLFGGYIGYAVQDATGSWLLSIFAAFVTMAVAGALLQVTVFRRLEGQELRQVLMTIGVGLCVADIMLWIWGGGFYQVLAPSWSKGAVELPFATAVNSSGEVIYLSYSFIRLIVLAASVALGIGLWLLINRTKVGMMIRAGVDDSTMLAATGARVQILFIAVFAFGAGLTGIAGVVGGTLQSLAPGEDARFLLASLVVVIVGGMGSITGAAIGALLVGLAEQLGSVYASTYAVLVTFVIMVAVLAIRPQGIMGRR